MLAHCGQAPVTASCATASKRTTPSRQCLRKETTGAGSASQSIKPPQRGWPKAAQKLHQCSVLPLALPVHFAAARWRRAGRRSLSAHLTQERKRAIVEPFGEPSGKTREELLYEFLLTVLRLACEARPCGRARCRRSGQCQEVEDAKRDFDPTTKPAAGISGGVPCPGSRRRRGCARPWNAGWRRREPARPAMPRRPRRLRRLRRRSRTRGGRAVAEGGSHDPIRVCRGSARQMDSPPPGWEGLGVGNAAGVAGCFGFRRFRAVETFLQVLHPTPNPLPSRGGESHEFR